MVVAVEPDEWRSTDSPCTEVPRRDRCVSLMKWSASAPSVPSQVDRDPKFWFAVSRKQTPYHQLTETRLFVLFLPELLQLLLDSSSPQVAGLCVGTAPALNVPTSVSAYTHGHCSVPNLSERLVLQFNLSVYYDQSFIKITKVFKYFALTLSVSFHWANLKLCLQTAASKGGEREPSGPNLFSLSISSLVQSIEHG